MSRHQKITSAIFGKDAQLVRLGILLATRELLSRRGLALGATKSEISSAVRTAMPRLIEMAGSLEVLRRAATSEEEIDRAKHEAVFSPYLYRSAEGTGDVLPLKRAYRSANARNGRTDRDRVHGSRNDRRRYLEKQIVAELLLICAGESLLPDSPLLRRWGIIWHLIGIDLFELESREVFGSEDGPGQVAVTQRISEQRAEYLFRELKPVMPIAITRITEELMDLSPDKIPARTREFTRLFLSCASLRDRIHVHVLRRLLSGDSIRGARLEMSRFFTRSTHQVLRDPS